MTSDRRLLQKALMSIVFHTDGHRRTKMVSPLPIREALDIIFRCDDHPVERVRWLLQKLKQDTIAQNVKQEALNAMSNATLPALARACQTAEKSRGTAEISFEAIHKRFDAETGTQGCVFEVGPCKTHFDSITGTVDLESVSTVHKPIDQCLEMLDPRNWGRCSPHFDPDFTYELKVDKDGRPVRDRRGELVRGSSSPLGEPWSGLMRERFDGEGICVENILDISFHVERNAKGAVTGSDMMYSLYSCERSQLGPLGERGGLRKNGGGMTAVRVGPGGSWTKVTVTKRVRYMDFTPGNPGRFLDLGDTLNVWASVMLCARADSEAVFNLCCDPKNPNRRM